MIKKPTIFLPSAPGLGSAGKLGVGDVVGRAGSLERQGQLTWPRRLGFIVVSGPLLKKTPLFSYQHWTERTLA